MPLSSALRFLGVWSSPMALAGSRPVYVCLQTIYGLNSGVFPSTLLHIPYPDQGVVWRSIQSVFTRLFTLFIAYLSAPQDMCICMLRIISPSPKYGLFPPPPEGMRIGIRRRPESPCTCSYIRSSLDQYLSTDSSVCVPVIPCALVAVMC